MVAVASTYVLAGALARIPVKERNHVESGMNNQLSSVSFDNFASPPDRRATFNGFRPSDGEAGKGKSRTSSPRRNM